MSQIWHLILLRKNHFLHWMKYNYVTIFRLTLPKNSLRKIIVSPAVAPSSWKRNILRFISSNWCSKNYWHMFRYPSRLTVTTLTGLVSKKHYYPSEPKAESLCNSLTIYPFYINPFQALILTIYWHIVTKRDFFRKSNCPIHTALKTNWRTLY